MADSKFLNIKKLISNSIKKEFLGCEKIATKKSILVLLWISLILVIVGILFSGAGVAAQAGKINNAIMIILARESGLLPSTMNWFGLLPLMSALDVPQIATGSYFIVGGIVLLLIGIILTHKLK